jgi:hypothetical protein
MSFTNYETYKKFVLNLVANPFNNPVRKMMPPHQKAKVV